MRTRLFTTATLIAALTTTGAATTSASAASSSCASITKNLITSEGFTGVTGPTVTPYNYVTASANEANALGTTYDFGPKAIIVGCVAPSDIAKLSAAAGSKTTMSAAAYMAYIVKQSAGAMTKTPVAGVSDYLDFGNGKEDGVGSLLSAGSIRLDAWVAGHYIFLTFSQPASSTPTAALTKFIHFTTANFK
jgi:hypothetical protein